MQSYDGDIEVICPTLSTAGELLGDHVDKPKKKRKKNKKVPKAGVFDLSETILESSDQSPVFAQHRISTEAVKKWKTQFLSDRTKRLAQKACTHYSTLTLMSDNDPPLSHVFNTKISTEVRPVVDQQSTGTCWIYAGLNVLRTFYCKHNKLDEFKFSAAHLFFWDKVERCNYLLELFLKFAQEGAQPSDRNFLHVLTQPLSDGGSWQMLVNLVEKYGLLPDCVYSTPYLAKYSHTLKAILNNQLRVNCYKLMNLVKDGKSDTEISETKEEMMQKLFEIISTCLGFPLDSVEYDFYDKDKKYHKIGPISPQEYYETSVKPHFDMSQQVVIINDPRPEHEYGKTYSVEYLGNMVGVETTKYLNLPIDKIEGYAKDSIKADIPVWFGCELKAMCSITGQLCPEQFDFELMFDISMRSMDKATRMTFGEARSSHAMVLNGLNELENGDVDKWRVENSWGVGTGAGKVIHVLYSKYQLAVIVKVLLPLKCWWKELYSLKRNTADY
ncbi:BLMH [Bugula neritina]|uniref:Bleomycin hydrolase n=1 Tax=Bugula neritina TaxID=10212 RepID=A0A7J7J619_BUGNE|nr:BLMH [Bugula neritina]